MEKVITHVCLLLNHLNTFEDDMRVPTGMTVACLNNSDHG